MQSKLIQELYKRTKPLVAEIFPESTVLKLDSFPAGWRAWELNQSEKLKMFLVLAPSPKDDSFALEIAWSIDGKFPEYDGRHPDEDRGKGKMYFRLSRFWQRYGAEHRWYLGSTRGSQEIMIPAPKESLEVKLESVAPQVEDAFTKLSHHGVPYMKQIAVRYGAHLVAKE